MSNITGSRGIIKTNYPSTAEQLLNVIIALGAPHHNVMMKR